MRILLSAFAALLILVSITVSPSVSIAQSENSKFNLFLLIDDTYFIKDGSECRIDIDRQSKILLKIHNENGDRAGGLWFLKGTSVNLSIDGRPESSYCAYAKTVSPETSGEVELVLHNTYLTTIDPRSIDGDEMLQLVVGVEGLEDQQIVDYDDVAVYQVEMPDKLQRSSTDSETEITRTSRKGSRVPSPTQQPATRTERTNSSETSRSSGNSSETTNQSGIVTGEWDLEGESSWDYMFVVIEEDPFGAGYEVIDDLDGTELAVEIGFPLIGEGRAPEGCRIFAFSGPLGIALYASFCADGDHIFYAAGTDKDALDSAIDDFIFDRPFRIPRGYNEVY